MITYYATTCYPQPTWFRQYELEGTDGAYFSASGGKSNYSDYSGYITTEMNAASHRLGGFASYSVFGGDLLELSLYGRLEINYTVIDVTSSLYALGYSEFSPSKYSSVSPSGSVGLELLIHLREFSFGAEGGYEVNIPGKLTHKESKNELVDPDDPDRILTSDWSGWCAQLKLLIWLNN